MESWMENIASQGATVEEINALRAKGFGKGGKRNIQCRNCGKMGHFAKECRSRPSTGTPPYQGGK